MKTWQELAKEHDDALKAAYDIKGELQAALITELRNKFTDFEIERKYDIHDQDVSMIVADGKKFYVGRYRHNDPTQDALMPDYPEIGELLYLWSL